MQQSPHIVRIAQARTPLNGHAYAIVTTVEIERHRNNNPPLPEWLAGSYHTAWAQLRILALRDLNLPSNFESLQSALAVVALSDHQLKLGALLNYLDRSGLDDYAESAFAWSELYTK